MTFLIQSEWQQSSVKQREKKRELPRLKLNHKMKTIQPKCVTHLFIRRCFGSTIGRAHWSASGWILSGRPRPPAMPPRKEPKPKTNPTSQPKAKTPKAKAEHKAKAEQPKLGKSGKKICCSCPETKRIRDACVVEKGQEHCAAEIEAHKVCLRSEGFVVE